MKIKKLEAIKRYPRMIVWGDIKLRYDRANYEYTIKYDWPAGDGWERPVNLAEITARAAGAKAIRKILKALIWLTE